MKYQIKKLAEIEEGLKKRGYTGQTVIHWFKGKKKFFWIPKPQEFNKIELVDERVGGTE